MDNVCFLAFSGKLVKLIRELPTVAGYGRAVRSIHALVIADVDIP